jgi:hypothetical protein
VNLELGSNSEAGVAEARLKLTATLADERRQEHSESGAPGARIVPGSWRAVFLAGLVTACLQASLDLGSLIALGSRSGELTFSGHSLPLAPMIILSSLWTGGRSSAFNLLFVRALLNSLEITSLFAYAIGGGLVTVLYALLMQALGCGDLAALPGDSAAGLAAGFFYRLFAGTKPA